MAGDEARLMVRLEATASKLIKEMQKAESETKRRMRSIDETVANSNRKLDAGLAKNGAAYAKATKGTKDYTFALQNAAFQVGDFAVQVAGGTSAGRAMAQQLPQLLGGLGLFGALAGAAAAIAIPLASNWLFAGDAAEETADSLSALDKALSGLRSANAAAALDPADLLAKYGQAADEMRGILDIQRQIAKINADSAFVTASGSVADQIFGKKAVQITKDNIADVSQAFDDMIALVIDQGMSVSDALVAVTVNSTKMMEDGGGALYAYNDALSAIVKNFDVGVPAAKEMVAAYLDLQAADTTEARAEAANRLAKLIWDATDGLKGASEEGVTLYQNLVSAVAAGLELSGLDLAGGIQTASAAAEILAQKLGISLATAQALVNLGPQGMGETPTTGGRGDPRTMGGSFLDWQTRDATEFLRTWKPPKVGGGGGGGSKAVSPDEFLTQRLEQAQAAAEAARIEAQAVLLGAEAAAKEKAQLDLLNQAKQKKLDLDRVSAKTGLTLRQEIERQAEAIAALTIETERYRERAQFMDQQNQALKDGFLDAIVEGKNFGEVLQGVAKQLAKAALEAALFGTGPLAGGGGGGLGNLFGGLLGGIFGGFRADGGQVLPGRAYVVGERGPEIFSPSQAGAIIPNGGGAGPGRSSRMVVDLSPDLQLRILRQAADQAIVISGQTLRQSQKAVPLTSRAYQSRGTV